MNRAFNNSFDLLRLVFALMVIITHSYYIVGQEEHDWLFRFTNGQTKFSTFAVNGFFIISGYLITKSLVKSASLKDYLIKRALRIIPAYWIVIIFTTLFLALVSSKSLLDVIFKSESMIYLLNNMFFRINYTIEGILGGKVINGSLWTIPYEVFFYCFIAILFWSRKSVRSHLIRIFYFLFLIKVILFSTLLNEISLPIFWLNASEIFRLGAFFLGGSLLSTFPVEKIGNLTSIILAAFAILIFSFFGNIYESMQFLILPIFIISIGLLPNRFGFITKNGDYSYGIYLWAFPIQQVLQYYLEFDTPWWLTTLTIPIVYFFGMCSWHLIENPSLEIKTYMTARSSVN